VDPDRALLVACLDLTSLGDDEDEAAIEALCERAVRPVQSEPELHVAAVCVWPRCLPVVGARLAGSWVHVACATGGFPLPDAPLADRLREIEDAVRAGAGEVDVPIDRFLIDEPDTLRGELDATRAAAGDTVWKAIVETGALLPDEIRLLADAAIDAGADFVKSSTGKNVPGVTPGAAAILATAVRDAGRPVGLKLSGGIRGAGQAANHLALVRAVLGETWPTPATFRIGASSLLDTLLA
jgi:deoxyribose-phosphate aldolase